MNRTTLLLILALSLVLATTATAQSGGFGPGDGTGSGVCNFIDEDGDGFNDLAPDADGDGIPNGLDPDYVRPEDGSGMGHRHGLDLEGETGAFAGCLLGEDGCLGEGNVHGSGHGYGVGDGTGTGVGPGDGTGFGPGDGTGDCDGTSTLEDTTHGRRGGRR